MTWAFRGEFDGPLKASDWRSRFGSQANPETLDQSEIGVLVATLYAHPLFTLSMRDSIRRQISQAEQFVASHPQWELAHDPEQARRALSQGKRVMVLALEGADGILETEEDLEEFVDRKGVRIVTLLHLTDDAYGGVAFLHGIKALASPIAWLTQLIHPLKEEGIRVNRNGLTDKGRALAETYIKRGVWIDLAHASDASARELIAMQEKAAIPLLYTHAPLRRYHGAERGIAPWQLEAVRKSGGILGLMPSEEMLEGTQVPARMCDASCKLPCEGGIQALATQYIEAAAALGAESVALGSDYNGGIPHLRPSCPVGTRLDQAGLWNIGQVPEVWASLEKLGAPVPRPRRKMVDRFLEAWERAWRARSAGH
jgi:microsomal dipeptidase-like Zn-dependent dipeptidase